LVFQSWFEVIFTWKDKKPPLFNSVEYCGVDLKVDYFSNSHSDTRSQRQHGVRYKTVEKHTYSYYLTFVVSVRTNKLTHLQKYSKRQEITHTLIKYLHDEKKMGYRKISDFLNRSGVKTQRNKTWSNSSVHSILKRKKQRDKRMVFRNKEYPVKIGKFELKYLRN